MASLPIFYRKNTEGTITSYDGMDIALGAGYKRYYAVECEDSTVLSDLQIDGNPTYASFSAAAGAEQLGVEYNFDLSFNRPQVIEGKCIAAVTYRASNTGSGTVNIRLIVRAYHVNSGGTETQLDAITTAQTAATGAGVSSTNRVACDLDIAKRTFAIGEKLRICVELYHVMSGAGTGTGYFYFDPTNRVTVSATAMTPTGAANSSALTVDVPYRIDL